MDPPALVGRQRSSAAGDCIVTVSSDASDWPDYLRRASGASLFHDPRWGLVMARAYGNRPFYLTARRDGAPVGLLQLIGQKSLLFGSHLCSLPYFDAAGILASDPPLTPCPRDGLARLHQSGAVGEPRLLALGRWGGDHRWCQRQGGWFGGHGRTLPRVG